MKDENIEFIESYNRIEKVLNRVFEDNHGLSLYINKMSSVNAYHIQNWDYDLKNLKKIRHTRNELVHSTSSLENNLYLNEDILYLKGFYNRLLDQDDPLSRYFNYKKGLNNKKNNRNNVFVNTFKKESIEKEEKTVVDKIGLFVSLLIFVIFIMACIIIIFFL